MQQATGFCKKCNQDRLVARKGTNHVLHLLLTICTGGLWLFIWVLSLIKIGGWRCQSCGSSAKAKLFK